MQDFATILRGSDLKVTPARVSVLSYLDQENTPLDVETIYKHILAEHEEVDPATVYRIVETLSQKGLIKRLEFGEGKYRYELTGDDHHHLYCESCGKIQDIADCAIEDLERDIKTRKGFIVKRHSLEFFGICSSCQGNKMS